MRENKILIYAGTTEGRRLAEDLVRRQVRVHVCVTTEYGESLLPKGEQITVTHERMDYEAMCGFIEKYEPSYVIDATHPFAIEVTKNLKNACSARKVPYLRLLRESVESGQNCIFVDDMEAAIQYLAQTEGNILAATGSKELVAYTRLSNYRERVYARVLSIGDVALKCEELGFAGRHLICMQGPFSTQMNVALLKEYEIAYMVTKESGVTGGYPQKCEAAAIAGVKLVVIGRPEQEDGHTHSEIIHILKKNLVLQDSLDEQKECEAHESVPRLLITASASGVGKTLLTCGILQTLKNRGLKLASFKCGPDYIDPMFHKNVLGIDSYNLDIFMCGREGVKSILDSHGEEVDIAVIEGVMGYYDGIAAVSTDASAYDVADLTDTPSVLIVDCKGMSVSIVSIIRGFVGYRSDSHIRGVILNRLSPMMYGRMKRLIERETGIRVYGYVPVMEDCVLESRYLGLCMPQELEGLDRQISVLAERLEASLDIDGLIELARRGSGSQLSEYKKGGKDKPEFMGLRIGVAKDEAFCFMYRDNLELLESMGVTLVSFSPVHDKRLPDKLDGLLLYGGYPELYARELSANQAMREDIKESIAGGLPCMAECGGFMYLQKEITNEQGESFPMVGVLEGGSYKTASLRRFGYVMLSGGRVFGQDVGEIRAHEFHYYDSDECGRAFTARKPLSDKMWECMISTDTLLAGYPHIHYIGNPEIASAFLHACKRNKQI